MRKLLKSKEIRFLILLQAGAWAESNVVALTTDENPIVEGYDYRSSV